MTTATDGGAPFTASRFSWEHLDRDAAAALWAELLDWTTWLRRTYELHQAIPPCWFAHPEIREELTALMAAHKAAYGDHEDTEYWSDMAGWHVYYLRPFASRVRKMADSSECRNGQCGYTPPRVETLESVHDYIGSDVEERPAPTATTPTWAGAERPTDTLDPKTVRAAVAEGVADLRDPSDPFSDVEYDGRRWRFDDSHNTYVPTD